MSTRGQFPRMHAVASCHVGRARVGGTCGSPLLPSACLAARPRVHSFICPRVPMVSPCLRFSRLSVLCNSTPSCEPGTWTQN